MRSELHAFEQILSGKEERLDLARACLMIAQDAYPRLDVDRYLGDIERMAIRLRARIPQSGQPEERVVALNQFLYGDLGFWGNTDDYYDPRNSYLNEVLERRTGIPITLSIVYLEVGRRIGLRLQGVSFPGHFLVKLRLKKGELVLDPFTGGEPRSESDLRSRLEQALTPERPRQLDLDRYLAPATPRDIVARVLRNLKGIYTKDGKLERALAVMQRLLLVLPESAEELRDRGLIYAQLECFRPAVADLQSYLRRSPEAADASDIHAKVVELRDAASRLQ